MAWPSWYLYFNLASVAPCYLRKLDLWELDENGKIFFHWCWKSWWLNRLLSCHVEMWLIFFWSFLSLSIWFWWRNVRCGLFICFETSEFVFHLVTPNGDCQSWRWFCKWLPLLKIWSLSNGEQTVCRVSMINSDLRFSIMTFLYSFSI